MSYIHPAEHGQCDVGQCECDCGACSRNRRILESLIKSIPKAAFQEKRRLFFKNRNSKKSEMLSKVSKSPQIRRFSVWDLEWIPGSYELRICGVFDPWNGYRSYTTIIDFLRHELTPWNTGHWYYAHFGGGADLQFVIEEICNRPEYSVKGSMSASSCVIAHIKAGRLGWHFVDSYWLLRSPLREIAKSLGKEKTGPTENMTDEQRKAWYATIDLETLRTYNENDCVILWEAIHRAQVSILELGGQLQMTLASTAMQLFRRKYLTQDIPTIKAINVIAKQSYFASRVEVYQKDVNYPGLYYDVNSSFPYAMTFSLPGQLLGNYRDIPEVAWDNYPFLADVEFEVPELWLPPMPTRINGKVFFPIGRWRSWMTGIDIKLLLREGGKLRRIHACKVFEPFYDLAEYARDLYAKRAATTDPFNREFYKLALNSLYGKFAEQQDKTTLLINPPPGALLNLDRSLQMLTPGVFFRTSEVPIPHAHVPISSYVTAIARQTLYDFMVKASEIHYCDTDGFSTIDEYHSNPGLGGLKLEKSYESATFLVPKLYRWQPADKSKPPTVKAKGFSLSKDKQIASKQFDHLIEGGEVRIERMVRIREMLAFAKRTGTAIHPHDKAFGKRLRQINFLKGEYNIDSVPKRFMYPDGHTRPWSYNELIKEGKK